MKFLENRIVRIALLFLVVVPLVSWFVVKPLRVIAPELLGLNCFDDGICIDDVNRVEEARDLRSAAIVFLSERISPFELTPSVIFCSSWKCAEKFGLGTRSAVSFGTFGIVISPRAWKPYYVRHELIHHLQRQELGTLKCLILPTWLIEGMAYSISEDPREMLEEPWQEYRSKFREWSAKIDTRNIWGEIRKSE
ncbi:hypothetical protein [Agarivorans sp. 1_MG-2023]|uniref:hypothetical protein n=1 Tax=Agarivorans sp. 1_MG-2023 TaxID=3062634 RepID=UPI0026E3F25C|nr:hypothetical protein [Agarivorans sp. 1_MG-2023]MDO6764288.1 hypothetical protein [Agarivorans sp. 1_MG-2023]